MTQKNSIFMIGTIGPIALAIGIAVGIGIGLALAPTPPDMAQFVPRDEHEDLQKRFEKTSATLGATTKQKVRYHKEKEKLAKQLADLSAQLKDRDEMAAKAAKEKLAELEYASTIPVAFGEFAKLDAVKNANWSEMGEAVENINGLLLTMVESLEKGEAVDPDLQDKIRAENNKLVRYAAQVMGKIPTNSPINGEFTHPLTLANLMGSMLERSGVPLSEQQLAVFKKLGNEYESEYAELQSGYGENTTRLEKLIDELELKRDVVNGMQGLLSDEQHRLVVQPELHHRLQLDTLSPFTMAIMLTKPRSVDSAAAVRSKFSKYAQSLGIDPETSGSLDSIADSFMRDLQPLLTPVEKSDRFLHIDRAITAGRAQANALKELLNLPGLDENTRKKILSEVSWAVPQIVKKAEKKTTVAEQ